MGSTTVRRGTGRIGLLSIVLALILSGCVRFIGDLNVSSRDEVSGSVIVATASSVSGLLGDEPNIEILKRGYEVIDGAIVSAYSEGGYSGFEVEFRDVPITTFSGAGGGLSPLSISRVGDLLVVEGNIDFSGASKEEGSSSDVTTAAFADIPAGEQFLRIRFKGQVKEANGLIDDDGKGVLWRLRLGEQNPIEAVVTQPLRGTGLVLVFIGVTLVLVVGATFLVLRVLSRRGSRNFGNREKGSTDL